MFNGSTVSIIVPVYKVEIELDRCVHSLVNQTHPNIEIILVDDGSPDTCPELCDQYAKEDNRIKVVHKENGGLSDARNAGLKKATGDYILYVDSDDYIDLDSCERLLNAIGEQEVDIVVGNAIMEKPNGEEKMLHSATPAGVIYSAKEFIIKSISAYQWYAPAWLNMYRREYLLENELYFKKGIYFEDMQMLPRVFLQAKRIATIDGTFYHYIVRDNSIMTTDGRDSKKVNDSIEIYRQWLEMFKNIDDKELQKYLYGILVKYYISNCKVRGIEGFVIDGMDFPFCLKNALNKKEKVKTVLFDKMPKTYSILARYLS